MSVCLDYFNCTDEKSRGRNKPKTLDFDSQLDFWGGGICKFIFYKDSSEYLKLVFRNIVYHRILAPGSALL